MIRSPFEKKWLAALLALSLAVFLSAPVCAQPKDAASPLDTVSRIIQLKHRSPDELEDILGIFGARLVSDRNSDFIGVNGPPAAVEAIELAIKELDVPRPPAKNVELTVYLLHADVSDEAYVDVPEQLAGVITQLQDVFTYTQYKLFDTLLLRCRDGSSVSGGGFFPAGFLPVDEQTQPATYVFRVDSVRVIENEDSLTIQLDRLTFGAQVEVLIRQTMPGPDGARVLSHSQFREVGGIEADIDVPEGKKVVVGKSSISAGGSALFVVLTAKVIEE